MNAAPDLGYVPNSLAAIYQRAGIDVEGDLSWSKEACFLDDTGKALTPSDHQVEALRLALSSDNLRFGLYDEPGVGKTVPAIAWLLYWASAGNRTIALMPPTLQEQFRRSMTDQLPGLPERFKPFTHFGITKAKREANFARWQEEDSWPLVMTMSYQLFREKSKAPWILIPTGPRRRLEPQNPEEPWAFTNARILQEAGYAALVFDEAHALKNRGSGISLLVKQFLGDPGERGALIMTGTPVKTDLRDCDGVIHVTAPEAYPTKKSFLVQHCNFQFVERKVGEKTRQEKVLTGFKRMSALTERLYRRGRRLQKSQVYPDLGKPIVSIRDVVLEGKHRTLYRKLLDEMILEMPDGSILDVTEGSALRDRALQMVATPHLFSDDAKLNNCLFDAVDEWVEEINLEETKLLVFANYKTTNTALQERLKKHGAVSMYGQNSPKKNNESATRFKEDPKCRILIAHPDSGGVGHNYQRVCHNVLFVEPTTSPGLFNQASERVVRPGQVHPVLIGILRVKGTPYVRRVRTMLERTFEAQFVTRDKTTMIDELRGIA